MLEHGELEEKIEILVWPEEQHRDLVVRDAFKRVVRWMPFDETTQNRPVEEEPDRKVSRESDAEDKRRMIGLHDDGKCQQDDDEQARGRAEIEHERLAEGHWRRNRGCIRAGL